MLNRCYLRAVLSGFAAVLACSAMAATTVRFNVPAQPLGDALRVIASQADMNVMFDEPLVSGKNAGPIQMDATLDEALGKLLADTGLTHRFLNEHTVVVSSDAGRNVGAADTDSRQEQRLAQSAIPSSSGQESPETRDGAVMAPDDGQTDSSISEIIVTAQKREQRLLDVPITIVAMGGAELESRGISDIRELSYAVPELAVFDNGAGGNQLFLRGIGGIGGSEPLVGFYLDEIAVSGQAAYPLDVRPLDLQRVEVLYGPQGTLYGQGSAGGTVRFITRKPMFGDTTFKLVSDTSFTHDGDSSQKFTGIANLPVVDQVFALRVAANYENTGGWVDAPSAGKENINGGELFEARITGLWNPSESVAISPMIMIHRNSIDSSGNGETMSGDKILPPFSPTVIPSQQDDYELYNVTGKVILGWAELLSSTSYYKNSSDGSFANAFNGLFFRTFETHSIRKVFNQEVRLSADTAGRIKWTIGAFYSDVNYDDVTIGTFSPTFQQTYLGAEQGASWSFFGNASHKITEKLEVGGGVRYFTQHKTDNVLKPHFDSVDPRVYLAYAISENIKTFASAAKGFRSGGFNADPAAPPQFSPEKVYSYELGVKFAALDSRVSGEFAVFHSDYENMQVDFLDPDTALGYTGNVGKSRIKGIDGSLRSELTAGTSAGVSATLLDTKVVRVPPNFGVDVGDRLNYIPKYSFGVFAQQKLKWADDVPGSIRIDYNQRGQSVFTSRTAGVVDMSGVINMLNARVAAEFRKFTLDVYAENLLNDRDRIIPNIVDFAPRPRPRTVGIQIGASF